jgi:hypothetical protein
MNLSGFKCMECGACCRQEGYVRLGKNEPDIIAAFLGMDVLQFIDEYTVLTRDRQALSLREKKNHECLFLTPKGCRINEVKPLQCREFPFKWKLREFATICAWAKKNTH